MEVKPPAAPKAASQRPVVAIRIFAYNASRQMLLLRRANTGYASGSWCLPGGKLDYGDTPEHTVGKELAEEAGLVAVDIRFLFYQNSPPPVPGEMHCVNLYFSCLAEGAVRLNEESSEYLWVSLREALASEPVFGGVAAIERLLEMTA